MYNAIRVGTHGAREAAECLAESAPRAQNVALLLAYLSRVIRHLEAARAAVVRHAT